jgi:hypothetical protein
MNSHLLTQYIYFYFHFISSRRYNEFNFNKLILLRPFKILPKKHFRWNSLCNFLGTKLIPCIGQHIRIYRLIHKTQLEVLWLHCGMLLGRQFGTENINWLLFILSPLLDHDTSWLLEQMTQSSIYVHISLFMFNVFFITFRYNELNQIFLSY